MKTQAELIHLEDPNLEDTPPVIEALNQLPPELQLLNRIYIRNVAQRSLLSPIEVRTWLTRPVTAFLRHDKVSVFAIVCGQSVAMANFVTLSDVTFRVNETARLQSNAGNGPLPNSRTIHAYLTGRLEEIADCGTMPDPEIWEPVCYQPLTCKSFLRHESQQPIVTCSRVALVPGTLKVWCPRSDSTEHRNGAMPL